jgi:ATP adenylyltransferase
VDHIWAPWRSKYVTSGVNEPGCILCAALERRDAADSLVVFVGRLNFVVLNLYPYTSGHLMVAPLRHTGSLADARSDELAEMMALARRAEMALKESYRAEAFNLGMNLGRIAGAGVDGHIHLHVVPRWGGDTNFMTTVAGARVMPEDLQTARARLRPLFEGTKD